MRSSGRQCCRRAGPISVSSSTSPTPNGCGFRGGSRHNKGPTWERRDAIALSAGEDASLHSDDVLNPYRQQCHASNEVLARILLSSPPAQLNSNVLIEIADVRRLALQMIEEIARHAGHLDAALELIDGRPGLGPRWHCVKVYSGERDWLLGIARFHLTRSSGGIALNSPSVPDKIDRMPNTEIDALLHCLDGRCQHILDALTGLTDA